MADRTAGQIGGPQLHQAKLTASKKSTSRGKAA